MRAGNGNGERQSFAQEVRRLTDSIAKLVRDHLELARAELKEDARRYALDAALAATALPFLLAALLLLDVALAIGLAGRLGMGWAFALVGALNLIVGGACAAVAAARMRRHAHPLPMTSEELERDRLLLQQLRQEMTGTRGALPPPGIRPYPPTPEEGRDGRSSGSAGTSSLT